MKIAVITGASAGIGREFVYAVDRQYELDEIWVIARTTPTVSTMENRTVNTPPAAFVSSEMSDRLKIMSSFKPRSGLLERPKTSAESIETPARILEQERPRTETAGWN